MENMHIYFLLVLILCELFESRWQQAPTMGGILENISRYYHRNIFILFLMHPSFYLVLYVFLYYGGHGIMLSIVLVMKVADIASKLWMVKELEKGRVSPEFRAMLSIPVPHWMPWINVVIYPALVALAFMN